MKNSKLMNLDKDQLYKENEKLELLNKLILEIAYKKDGDDLLYTALKTITSITDADFGYILSFAGINSDQRIISAKYNLPYGFLKDLKELKFKTEDTIKNITNSGYVKQCHDWGNPIRKHISDKYHIKTVVEIPIIERNKIPVASIYLFSTKHKDIFVEHTLFLEAVSNTILILLNKQKESEENQQKLLRAEKLKTLGELCGGIAHDFNNALATIIGFCQMALAKETNPDVKGYLDIIYSSAIDGKNIVDKIQMFNRKRSAKERDYVELNSIVESGLEMAKPKWKNFYESKGLNIDIIKILNSNSKILCNEYEIRESILNIILNAMDAMDKGGSLTIKTYDDKENVFLEIQDTGSGMTEEVRENIFEPFFSTKEERGTGLGLSITKNIIESHEGSIWVRSKIGEGTNFTIAFKSHDTITETQTKRADIPSFKGVNAIVIDDKIDVANSVAGILELMGISTDVEVDPFNLKRSFGDRHYDLVFCDLSMPKINGLIVTKRIKEKYPDIKIILMTGWPENIEKDKLDHIDYLLEKPFTMDELIQLMNKIVEI